MTYFYLKDAEGRELKIGVESKGTFLNIHPEGFYNPVSLDFYEGKLRVLLNLDVNIEEPQIINLEGASECL